MKCTVIFKANWLINSTKSAKYYRTLLTLHQISNLLI